MIKSFRPLKRSLHRGSYEEHNCASTDVKQTGLVALLLMSAKQAWGHFSIGGCKPEISV